MESNLPVPDDDAPVNPRTGLRETYHEFLRVPVVHQTGIGRLRLQGQRRAVHTVPLAEGVTLDFYSDLGPSEELLVSFHGANMPGRQFYPRFERIRSLLPHSNALLAFADPTQRLDPTGKIRLSWYLGGAGWDPLYDILKAVRAAQRRTGARHIAFIGGSGGGFAALRASAMLPGSLAYVQDPQTVVRKYARSVLDEYFPHAWPGWDRERLMQAFPHRFDVNVLYRDAMPQNFVYYAQNRSDTMHMQRDFAPFARVHQLDASGGLSKGGNRLLAVFDGERAGHGKITAQEYQHHLREALKFWRARR